MDLHRPGAKQSRMSKSEKARTGQPTKKRSPWTVLDAHCKEQSKIHLRQLFANDPGRGERMTLDAVDLFLDYSKNRVTDETLKLLFNLANGADLQRRIGEMFSGETLNVTEKRAVLHVA